MIPLKPSRYWRHPPSAKQYLFLALPHEEALYGGAAGGGKTDALLMGALQYVDVPGYSALLLRRTYKQLTQSGQLLDLANQWLRGTDARWDANEAKWKFPSGATISFGHLDSERDLENYSGPTYQYIAFDEVTQFPERHYMLLRGRLRRLTEMPVPLRIRCASNPGGKSHRFVKKRFIDQPRDRKRAFVPARVRDNPALDADRYEQTLSELDKQTREQLLEGNWDARPAGDWFFDDRHLAEVERLGARLDRNPPPPAGGVLYVGIDWGENFHCVPIWPLERGGIYVPPKEVQEHQLEPGAATRKVLAMADRLPFPLHEARYDAAGVQSMRTFALTARVTHPSLRTEKVAFGTYKAETAQYLRLLVERAGEGKRTSVLAISPHNEELLAQLPELESDPENPAGCWLKDEHQHGVDALVAGVAPVAGRFRRRLLEDIERAKAEAVRAAA